MPTKGRRSTVTPLLTISEAAKLLGVSEITVRRLVAAAALPCIRFSPKGPMRFDVRDVERLVERCKG